MPSAAVAVVVVAVVLVVVVVVVFVAVVRSVCVWGECTGNVSCQGRA